MAQETQSQKLKEHEKKRAISARVADDIEKSVASFVRLFRFREGSGNCGFHVSILLGNFCRRAVGLDDRGKHLALIQFWILGNFVVEMLFAVGERDFKFFIVRSGEVEILDYSGDEPKTVTVHRKGEFTGDISHLTGLPAVVSAVARGDCEVYE